MSELIPCDLCGQEFKNRHGLAIHKSIRHGKPGVKTKRKVKLKAESQVTTPVINQVELHFCPHCGNELTMFNAALAMAARLKQ